jgi:tetratricopeptide (TPR) repeat protein
LRNILLKPGEKNMAEGLLEGVLGGEEEKIDPTVGGAEPLAAAIATNLASQSPEVAAETVAFLRQQTNVLRLQEKNLEAEYEFFESEAGPRLLALRLRAGFQLFFALFATVFGLWLAIIIFSATQSRSVVIEPFDIAPNAAGQAPSGKMVAAGFLDVLNRIQAATRSHAERRSLSNAWTKEISIEIPETGVSIGQLERLLKTRFGHDQHIDGDLALTEEGQFALTVRGTGVLPNTFVAERRELGKLLLQAGEYVYSQSMPVLWLNYLTDVGRESEAKTFAQQVYAKVDVGERPHVLNQWGAAIFQMGGNGAAAEALALWREAVRLQPDDWNDRANIMASLWSLGDEEGVVHEGEEMIKVAGGRPGSAGEESYSNFDQVVWNLPDMMRGVAADLGTHEGGGTQGAAPGDEALNLAQIEVQMHDVDAASIRLKTANYNAGQSTSAASAAVVRALIAEETGDLHFAAEQWDTFAKLYADPSVSSLYTSAICFSPVAYEKTGQSAKADAALNAVGKLTFVDCYRFRGDVLDIRGDWAGAQEWYAKAVKLGPSIPSGYYSWGLALAKHGDLAGAAAKLQLANQKGPHWADPLKAWGDVLVKQGNAKDALVKYDEALKYAPNWKQLREAREAAVKLKT